MKRPSKASTIFRDFIAESIFGVSVTYMCTSVYVCVRHALVYICVCSTEILLESPSWKMNNERKYLPHIAIKIAKKTVPPLSNKYVTLIEKIETLIILKTVLK